MDDNTKYYQYILLKIAQKRHENEDNRRNIFRKGVEIDGKKLPAIELGHMDLIHDFLALILLLNTHGQAGRILTNKEGIFIPSVMSSIRYMPGIETRTNEKGQEIVLLLTRVFKGMNAAEDSLKKEITDSVHFSPGKIDELVKKIYPASKQGLSTKETICFFLRIAGCFWLSGRPGKEMPLKYLKECYRHYWGSLDEKKLKMAITLFKFKLKKGKI